MKLHQKALTTGLVAVALAAVSSLSGQVTPPAAVNAATGDLIFGFWQTNSSATGYTSNLEVDLGAYSAYAGYAGSGTLTHFTVTNIGTDLTATYGSWTSNPTLLWGAVRAGGGTGGSTPDGVISKANANPAGGPSTPYDPGFTTVYTGSAARLINNKASTLLTLVAGSYNGIKNPAYTGSNASAAIVPTGNSTSWSTTAGVTGGTSSTTVFSAGVNNPDYNIGNFAQRTNFSLTNGYEVADLYFLKFNAPGNVTETYVGSLGLSADGTITYANQATYFSAVPEPSTYAAIAGVLTIGLALCRRRQAPSAEVQL